jgi:butyryl-CoA dehydrogenase
MHFVFYELFEGERLSSLPHCEDFTKDLMDSVLEEGAKFSEKELQPLNLSGDSEGCRFLEAKVFTPKGFKEAYSLFCQAGWTSMACDTAFGGQAMPLVLGSFIQEMLCSANLSFALYPELSHGAYTTLEAHASEAIKQKYLPKIVDGTWAATMCLTESHCGSDLGLLKTKAIPNDDSSFTLSGTKIFISAGEHDLTDNIIHLVLARLPDAPPGVKGISLFLVPKFLVQDDGSLGDRNHVVCSSIEHKMGMRASSTCVMNFDSAKGWLIGEPHKGLNAMFTMMNEERLAVGIQGLGIGEAAYQGAVAYARERLQGRSPEGLKNLEKGADPLIVHPDIRRMLLTMRAYVEGCRALSSWVSFNLDYSYRHLDPRVKQRSEDFVALMTPIVKAFMTDLGFEIANHAVQIFGGHGYIHDYGMEQLVRDCRVTQIYEGTNGIQALDLVSRKLVIHEGRYLDSIFIPIADFIDQHRQSSHLKDFMPKLIETFELIKEVTHYVKKSSFNNPAESGAAATDYLRLLGLTTLAFLWTRMVDVSMTKIESDDSQFYKAKIVTAKFFFHKILPQCYSLRASILSGSEVLMALSEEDF